MWVRFRELRNSGCKIRARPPGGRRISGCALSSKQGCTRPALTGAGSVGEALQLHETVSGGDEVLESCGEVGRVVVEGADEYGGVGGLDKQVLEAAPSPTFGTAAPVERGCLRHQ